MIAVRLLLIMSPFITSINISWAWHLEVRPSIKYTTQGGNPRITCYNITSTATLAHNTRWYKIVPNGTLEQISTDVNERVRSDRSQLRISSARNDDNGTYCCKGPTQALDTCDETATASLIIVISPVIVSGQNQTVQEGRSAVLECSIENVGNPPFVVARWQKLEQRLVTNGIKYTARLMENRMFLIIFNSTTEDEGYYQCMLETLLPQRREASVYLFVNQTDMTHAGPTNVSLPKTTYALQIFGPNEVSSGINLTVRCVVTKSNSPVDGSGIQLCLVLPTGEVIVGREFNTVATLEHSGTYSCIANINSTLTVARHPVTVYAAPQPLFHSKNITALYGSNVTLPCTIDVANPQPSYKWENLLLHDTSSSETNTTLRDGSLLLKNVQKSGMYKCTAFNSHGSSIQMIQLKVVMTTNVIKNKSLELIGRHLKSSCDQPQHLMNLSMLLQEYIGSICTCGDITVTVIVTSCADKIAVYNIQLIGVMATEATLSLITNMEILTEGLDLGIVLLFLQGHRSFSQPNCNGQNNDLLSVILAVIGTLSVIMLMLIIFLVIFVKCTRKKVMKNPGKLEVKDTSIPYYSTVTLPGYASSASSKSASMPCYSATIPPCYALSSHQLQHNNKAPVTAPIQKPTSNNGIAYYEEIQPKHQNNKPSNDYTVEQ